MNLLSNLLAEGENNTGNGLGSQIFSYVILGLIVVIIIVMFVFSYRRRKKQEQEEKDLRDSLQPGVKVKTIGGICGIVVEVDDADGTFVLETGSEEHGKSFMKFDKRAILDSDAKREPEKTESSDNPVERETEEGAAETLNDNSAEQPAVEEIAKDSAPETEKIEDNGDLEKKFKD